MFLKQLHNLGTGELAIGLSHANEYHRFFKAWKASVFSLYKQNNIRRKGQSFLSLLITIFLCLSVPSYANNSQYAKKTQYNKKPQYAKAYTHRMRRDRHGMYNRYYYTPTHIVAFKAGINYFGGDIEMPSNLLLGYHDIDPYRWGSNNSVWNNVSGDLGLIYCYRPKHLLAIRTSTLVGYLRGYGDFYRETKKGNGIFEREFERQFQSCMIEYSVGCEFYPMRDNDFFLYVGFGGATSFIYRNFNAYLAPTNPELNVHDRVVCNVPMMPVGLGYKWECGKNGMFGVELIWHTALCDKAGMNLDGYQSGYIYKGKEYYPVIKSTNVWQDSFMELSFTIGGFAGWWRTSKHLYRLR